MLSYGTAYETAWRAAFLSKGGILLFISRKMLRGLGNVRTWSPGSCFSVGRSWIGGTMIMSTSPRLISNSRSAASGTIFWITLASFGLSP